MLTLADIQALIRQELPLLRTRYRVEAIGVFGSFARGEATDESDIDLLVTFSETPSMFDFVGLGLYLEERLGRKVDLGTPDGLKPYLAPYILREVAYV